MKKLRLGILGCSNFASRTFIPNLLRLEQFELVAIASRSLQKAKSVAEKFNVLPVEGYQNLIERDDIDCVYIPLPIGLHYEWIRKSLAHGKHVFSEKSFTESYSRTKEIIELAKSKKLCVFENFMFTYHSQYDYVFEMLRSGEIGEIRLLKSAFGFPEFDRGNNIRYKKNLAGGALLDAGAYTVKASTFILGKETGFVAAELNTLGNEVDYQGSVMLKNEQGLVAQLSFGFDNFYQNNIEIWGSKGKLTLTRAFTAGEGFMPGVVIEKQNKRTEIQLPADNQMRKILLDFATAIESDYSKQFKDILLQSRLLTDIIENG